ncbi:MAG: N-acetylmuramic acid 6-phosphate etherase [Planctomycetaceae bacterium]|nr:N-acetylmuramic acid 6-phosphate etherase [Planctomycetaceae bacterium]
MLDHLTTEARNPASEVLDQLDSLELVRLINSEDAKIAAAVAAEEQSIAKAIDVIANRLSHGGRLVYIGAGTSGRLGVLDASECPPTFNADPSQVVGLIAGGQRAMFKAVEGAEDSPTMAADDLREIDLCSHDVLVGIATSGRTPYVIGALDYARSQGAYTVGLTCNRDALLSSRVDVCITPVVGPEVLSGSTRMKAGTATKMVLNMLTTGAMVRMGKTFGNLMVDLQATNSKLLERTKRIVCDVTNLPADEALALLQACGGELKTAIVSHRLGASPEAARKRLDDAHGHLRRALEATPSTNGHAPKSKQQ